MLDDLYRAHPSEFVAARDALAKELASEGERDEAARVKRLRRPSAAAWLLNAVALTKPKVLREFAKASEALEKAQARALEGGDAGKWRTAAGRERGATEAVIETAEAVARDAGHPATKQALDLVDGTLRAAAADPELRGRVVAGRLEREQSGATIGALGASASPSPRGAKRSAKAPKASARETAKAREVAEAKRELRRLERELAKASAREERLRGRVEAAAEALRNEKAGLDEAKRDAAALKRQTDAAGRRAKP